RERLRLLKPALKKVIVELNTFQYFPHNDRQLQYQRYATRLYIFLIIISVTILAGYNLMDTSIHRHTVTNPSESQYLILEEDNPTDLICKCANISVSYSSFITIQPQLHQVCLSYLIKPEWMMHSDSQSWAAQNILDYRIAARKQFQTLAILCEQAKSIINDALEIFLQTQLVNSQIISEDLFTDKMNHITESWKNSTIIQFKSRMELIRITTMANQLMTPLNTLFKKNLTTHELITEPQKFGECTCGTTNHTCIEPMKIYEKVGNNFAEKYTIPNFFVGCYPIEALFSSTLECFYNESCM
ncbi:unnamed protein product, partial [Adineta steineri]